MSLLHERWRRRVSLLAAGALTGAEREAALEHVQACSPCREQHAALLETLTLLRADPAATAEPGVPLPALVTRVQARIDALETGAALRAPAWPARLRPAGAAAAVAVAVLVLLHGPTAHAPTSPPRPEPVSAEVLERLETTLARERAARYLNEAQDVLVTLAARPHDCDRGADRVDVADEAQRSRELLAQRALLLELEGGAIASARPVLEDVEQVLREVASLESCARNRDLAAIHRQMEERRLLMKMDLMARELVG